MENEIQIIKNQLEKHFADLNCHIVQRSEYDLFEDLNKISVEKWKQEYILEFDKIKDNGPDYVEDWKVLKVIEAFNFDFCSCKKMADEIKKIYRKWDWFAKSMKFRSVEASLESHVCYFWDECKESCNKNEDDKLHHYSKLSLNMYGEG